MLPKEKTGKKLMPPGFKIICIPISANQFAIL